MSQRIPLILISSRIAEKFLGIGERLAKIFPNIGNELRKAGITSEDKEYLSVIFFNSAVYFLFFLGLFFILLYAVQHKSFSEAILKSLGFSFLIFFMLFAVLLRYPSILSGKKAEKIDKNLLFALKDMTLQISSGVSLYNSMVNISKAGYGEVSADFGKVGREISSGISVEKALQKLAIESSSEFMRRTIWQLINTIRVGASLKGTLKGLINELNIEQKDKIRSYSRELNMWVLAYMLFAVAVPTIGATVLVILSGFAGYTVTKETFIIFILVNFVIQYILIGFVKFRRPIVHI